MDKSKSATLGVLIVFFMCIFAVLGMFLNRLGNTSFEKKQDEDLAGIIARAEEYDFHIYWIGDCPDDLLQIGNKITVLSTDLVNEDLMPIPWPTHHIIERDSDGNVINEIFPRNYASHMLIVVRSGVVLTDDQLEIIRRCQVENSVDLLMFGSSVTSYRIHLLRTSGTYQPNDNVLYSNLLGETDDYINPDIVNDNDKFVIGILDLMYSLCDERESRWHEVASNATSEVTDIDTGASETIVTDVSDITGIEDDTGITDVEESSESSIWQ